MWYRFVVNPMLSIRSVLGLVFVLSAGACSDSDLYSSTGLEPLRPDRIAVAGKVCTEDTSGSRFPVKVLVIFDSSLDMQRADPSGLRFVGPSGSLDGLIQRNRNQPHVRFGFVGLSSTAKALPPPNGQRYFRPQDPEVSLALVQLQSLASDNQRDLMNALSQAESFITGDMATSSPGEILRTRYLVYMLLAGPPSPPVTAKTVTKQVEALRDLVYESGALEFSLNIGLMYYGPRTIDQAPEPYNCYAAAGACTCPGGGAGGQYCSVYCDVTSGVDWEGRMATAREVYEGMTFAGNGRFVEYPCPWNIDVNVDIASTTINLVKKDIVAYNTNVLLTTDGPELDSDGDGLTDSEESNAPTPTDPLLADTDGDGLGDRVEFRTAPRQNPLDNTDRPRSCPDPGIVGVIPDRDLDLLNDCEEGLLETSATIPDSDGDGLTDYLEFMSGTLPTSDEDRLLDFDADGIPNAVEVTEHLNPRTNDGRLRGEHGYRSTVTPLGMQRVPFMEDTDQLRAVVFRSASAEVVGGQAYIKWDPAAGTLEWSDARFIGANPYTPQPVTINGSGVYRLEARAPNGLTIWCEVYVTVSQLPDSVVEVYPLITVTDRNCYDVRISNIKLLETKSNDASMRGVNRILMFFTQAPSDRLTSPGISQVAELRVRYQCTDPDKLSTCARNPSVPALELTTDKFVTVLP